MKQGLLALLCLLGWFSVSVAQTVAPPAVQAVEVEEFLGRQLPLELRFEDSVGRERKLSEFFDSEKPVLLVLAYYNCPMLCNLIIDGVVKGVQGLDWKPGQEFRVVTISFDPKDNVGTASRKQQDVLSKLLQPPENKEYWPFLYGKQSEIEALTNALGFRYQYDARTKQYAHASVIFAISPQGKISRYLYGVNFEPKDVKLALGEASEGKIGSFADKVLMVCFQYDPLSRKYGFYIFGFLRTGALLILLVVGTWLFRLWRRERQEREKVQE